jgi:cell fate (sporulation/competence/biofilm development) regulator YlbF (YheA/YmcA/DUF963 family)
MNDKVRQSARDFASALKATPPVSRYLKAIKKMEDNDAAQKLVAAYQQKQRDLFSREFKATERETEWKALRDLQIKVVNNPLIKEISEAQNDAFEYCRTLGEDLSRLLGVDFGGLAAPPASC